MNDRFGVLQYLSGELHPYTGLGPQDIDEWWEDVQRVGKV